MFLSFAEAHAQSGANTSGILLPVARSGGQEMMYFAGLFGLFCSVLSPPTILGWAVHGIFLLIKKKKKQNTSNLETEKEYQK
jgi:hypothetical protein